MKERGKESKKEKRRDWGIQKFGHAGSLTANPKVLVGAVTTAGAAV